MKRVFTLNTITNFFILVLFSTTNTIQSQKIGIQQLENVTRLSTVDEKCNFFYGKNFVKENNSNSSKIVLVKKIFDKKLQEFDEEIITIDKDTIIYSLINPKKYINFKKAVEYYSYRQNTDLSSNKFGIIYEKKYFIVKLNESEKNNDNSKPIHFFNFSIYKKEN